MNTGTYCAFIAIVSTIIITIADIRCLQTFIICTNKMVIWANVICKEILDSRYLHISITINLLWISSYIFTWLDKSDWNLKTFPCSDMVWCKINHHLRISRFNCCWYYGTSLFVNCLASIINVKEIATRNIITGYIGIHYIYIYIYIYIKNKKIDMEINKKLFQSVPYYLYGYLS